jgi:hypothetical protein
VHSSTFLKLNWKIKYFVCVSLIFFKFCSWLLSCSYSFVAINFALDIIVLVKFIICVKWCMCFLIQCPPITFFLFSAVNFLIINWERTIHIIWWKINLLTIFCCNIWFLNKKNWMHKKKLIKKNFKTKSQACMLCAHPNFSTI